GRVAREDDALRAGGRLDEAPHLRARVLVRGRRFLRQLVEAAVDVRVVALVVGDQRVDDLARLLRRRRVVEVGERLAVHLALEDGEVFADGFYVIHGVIALTRTRGSLSEAVCAVPKPHPRSPSPCTERGRER